MIRKILLVDNDQVLQIALKQKLAACEDQFQVVQVEDGFEALKKLEEGAFSLICTELMLPRMNGMILLSHIREKFPDVPVIVLSGSKRKVIANGEEMEGVIALIEKPILADELQKLILAALQEEAEAGIMHNVSPTMFMQLMEMEEKTCTIRMLDNASDEGGIVYLRDGQILDARVGTLKGAKAVTRIFFWNEVTVFLRNECAPRESVINSAIQPIIMAALAAKDELEDSDFTENAGQRDSSVAHLRKFLESNLGEQYGICSIASDDNMIPANKSLDTLGVHSGFGDLKVGHIKKGQGKSALFIPGVPPIVLDSKPGCPVEDILQVLKTVPDRIKRGFRD